MPPLSRQDLDDILEQLPASHAMPSAETRGEMLDNINRAGRDYDAYLNAKNATKPSNMKQTWEEIGKAAEHLGKLLAKIGDEAAYAYYEIHETPRLTPTAEELKELFPGIQAFEIQFIQENKVYFPSDDAKSFVTLLISGLRTLVAISKKGVAFNPPISAAGPPPKQANHLRYNFVYSLSLIYKRAFPAPPRITAEGHWVVFLSELLCSWEGKPLTPGGARSLWKDTKDFVSLHSAS